MNLVLIFPQYLLWHYLYSIKNIFNLWKDFSWFILRFFSISRSLRTLFHPFKRLSEKPTSFGIEQMLESFIVNILMRIVGVTLRSLLIFTGLMSLFIFSVFSFVFFFFWLALPVLIGALVVYSFSDFLKFIIR